MRSPSEQLWASGRIVFLHSALGSPSGSQPLLTPSSPLSTSHHGFQGSLETLLLMKTLGQFSESWSF